MAEYNEDLQKWSSSNIFMQDKEFADMQLSLVPIKLFSGSYQVYSTKISPQNNKPWVHIILLPGTAFKFPNQLNAEYTAKSLLSILQIKSIPTKIYSISHRINPIFPQASTDTLEILKIILKDKTIKSVHILTWSAGFCHLREVIEMVEKAQCKVKQLILVSPVPDLSNKKREKCLDFLNQDFFEFVEKVYCAGDLSKVQALSLGQSLKKQGERHFLINYPISIVYGSQQYIRKDIEQMIEELNQRKNSLNVDLVNVKCYEGQNHALFSFVTTQQTRDNIEAIEAIAATKWQVSKHIADQIENLLLKL